MSLGFERRAALNRTREFLRELINPGKTPRVPKSIRQRAYDCLKHYPWKMDLENKKRMVRVLFEDGAQFEKDNK